MGKYQAIANSLLQLLVKPRVVRHVIALSVPYPHLCQSRPVPRARAAARQCRSPNPTVLAAPPPCCCNRANSLDCTPTSRTPPRGVPTSRCPSRFPRGGVGCFSAPTSYDCIRRLRLVPCDSATIFDVAGLLQFASGHVAEQNRTWGADGPAGRCRGSLAGPRPSVLNVNYRISKKLHSHNHLSRKYPNLGVSVA